MKINKVIVMGTEQEVDTSKQSENLLKLQKSYLVGSETRATDASHQVILKEDEVVELVFNDGVRWLCGADSLQDIYPGALTLKRGGEAEFEIPMTLTDRGERGMTSDVFLKVFNVLSKKLIGSQIKKFAGELEKKQLLDDLGLLRLDSSFQFHKFNPEKTNKPYLLFIHGTSSSTIGSFGKLSGSPVWNHIQQNYGSNVLAFQHETLTKSPLQNVHELVKQLPEKISLDIISHSRGGLVGDILSRFANEEYSNKGFTDEEISLFEKSDRPEDIRYIKLIRSEIKNKKININKFIRVACPACGTTLASGRVEYFFNMIFNLLGLEGEGILVSAFRNLISSVINSKNDLSLLPGLEAMNPESPFIKAINNSTFLNSGSRLAIDKSLTIISGNCKANADLKSLPALVGNFFYKEDNDLVVNTNSMYLGTKRTGLVQYFFDVGDEVNHFNYFNNKKTRDAILLALQSDGNTLIPGYFPWSEKGLTEGDRNVILNLLASEYTKDEITGKKPIAILVPGIMGSNLKIEDDRIWIDLWDIARGKLMKLKVGSNKISASSVMKSAYKNLCEYLSDEYDVLTFPYDWRLKLSDAAVEFEKKINELLKHKQPIKILAHSMGGVMVREFILNHKGTWEKLNNSPGFKMIFLGVPFGGSFRIPAVLCGQESTINKLDFFDRFNKKEILIKMFSGFPGILNLLPLTKDPENDFAKLSTWDRMYAAMGSPGNSPLTQSDLNEFAAFRDNVLKNADKIDYKNCVYIAGKGNETMSGYRIKDNELVFISTNRGDESVTWESGIPKIMEQTNSVYYTDTVHGELANEENIFKGISEILINGTTNLIGQRGRGQRGLTGQQDHGQIGEEKLFRASPQFDFDLSAEGFENTMLGLGKKAVKDESKTPIKVSVTNGDLKYSAYPVLAGHFKNDGILFAEKVINRLLNNALTHRHILGLYPGDIGTSKILYSAEENFKGAIIVGVGELGSLTAYRLTQSIEQGVCNYLLEMNDKTVLAVNQCKSADCHLKKNPAPENYSTGITSLMICSGFGGLSVESSIKAIIQGVTNANDKVKKLMNKRAYQIESIEFIEVYEDRALSCSSVLKKIEQNKDNSLNIVLQNEKLTSQFGKRKRIVYDGTEDWWTTIDVRLQEAKEGEDFQSLLFTVSTGSAREEQQTLYTGKDIIENLLNEASKDNRWSAELAKTIFELLIPNEFKELLKRQNNISWKLDKYTASFPWELLQDEASKAKPLSINAGMIRKLETKNYKQNIREVTAKNALIIADPDLKGSGISQLPGALEEGKAVEKIFKDNNFETIGLFKDKAPNIIKKLFSNEYKIIHLAGHGIFNENILKDSDKLIDKEDHTPACKKKKTKSKGSGMVIGKDVFLTTKEISQMSTAPELVFVNCCYLGEIRGSSEALYHNLYKLAANIGTQLIENGVKAVVAAGWTVDDAAALEFAKVFYEKMFDGEEFGKAIRQAREHIYVNFGYSNTWGAYQCYGDQFYKFRIEKTGKEDFSKDYVINQEAEIDLYNLQSKIDMGKYDEDEVKKEIKKISDRVDKAKLRNAVITEKEAYLYSSLKDYDTAIDKYKLLQCEEKASFSFRAMEQYCNLRVKKCASEYKPGSKKNGKLVKEMNLVIKDISSLLSLGETSERLSILASAYKRKSIITEVATKKKELHILAAYNYQKSYKVKNDDTDFYAYNNWIQLEAILAISGQRNWGDKININRDSYKIPTLKQLKVKYESQKNKSEKLKTDNDYWSFVTPANIKLTLFMMNPVRQNHKQVAEAYKLVWDKAGSEGKKRLELEHIDFLIDALGKPKGKTKAAKLKKKLEDMRDELKGMI